ncbi:MAG: alpha-ketoacid dehydrogenase subunit beta [Acidimicrobiia bacterium]
MATMTIVEAIRDALFVEMERDERVMVLGEDVGGLGGVFRATDGLRDRFGAARVVDTPLAEAAIVGITVGLAAAGMVPVAEIQFLGFTLQAMHQMTGQLARLRSRSNGALSCQAVIRSPFGGLVRTPELHSDAMEALFVQSPGLKVVAPATAADAKGLLTAAIRDPDPVLVLEPLRGYRGFKDDVPAGEYVVPLGSAREVREGTDCVVIAWSAMVQTAERAAEKVTAETGASIAVLDLRSLVPLDVPTIVDVAARCGRVVVAQEAPQTGGFGSEVITVIQENAFWSLEAPIARVSGFDVPYPTGMLEEFFVPSVERVAAAIRRTLEMQA